MKGPLCHRGKAKSHRHCGGTQRRPPSTGWRAVRQATWEQAKWAGPAPGGRAGQPGEETPTPWKEDRTVWGRHGTGPRVLTQDSVGPTRHRAPCAHTGQRGADTAQGPVSSHSTAWRRHGHRAPCAQTAQRGADTAQGPVYTDRTAWHCLIHATFFSPRVITPRVLSTRQAAHTGAAGHCVAQNTCTCVYTANQTGHFLLARQQ